MKRILSTAIAYLFTAAASMAQTAYMSPTGAGAGYMPGVVLMCVTTLGYATPCGSVSGMSSSLDSASYPVTFSATGNTVSGLTGSIFPVGTTVVFSNTGGALPTGVNRGQPYVIATASDTAATLRTVDGTAVTFSAADTGTSSAVTGYTIPINSGMATILLHLSESGSASFGFLSSPDGVGWDAVTNLGGNVNPSSVTLNASGQAIADVSALKYFAVYTATGAAGTYSIGWTQSSTSSKSIPQAISASNSSNMALENGHLSTIDSGISGMAGDIVKIKENTGSAIPPAATNKNVVGAIQICDQTLTTPNCVTISNNAVSIQQAVNVTVAGCTTGGSVYESIQSGGTAVTRCSAQNNVKLITLCNMDRANPSGGEDAWVNIKGGTALANDAGSFLLPQPTANSYACRTLPPGFNGPISFVAATAGHILYEDQE